MASILLDQFGDPMPLRTGGGGQLLTAARREGRSHPQEPTRMESISRAVPYRDWQTTVSASRRLWANFDLVKGATIQKAMHSVGRAWSPKFLGKDQKWGETARAWLEDEWYEVCDVRGSVFDFKTLLFLDSISFDRDGDNGMLLTETADGYPQTQRVPCHRIGQHRYNSGVVGPDDAVSAIITEDGTVQWIKGLYAGMRIEQGVIYNVAGCAVAHRLIGAYGAVAQDISARDFDVRYDPEYYDQCRGLPAISGSIDFLASSFTGHEYEMQALNLASSIGLTEWNDTGGADPNDPSAQPQEEGNAACDDKFKYETFEGGMIRYFKAGGGGRLEAFRNAARPGEEWDSLQDRVVRIALAGINWPYSLVWKPESMNGTQERSAIEQGRTSIADRQDLLRPRAKRAAGYACSKAMKLGILPPYRGEDRGGFLKWGFEMPAQFSIDHGKDSEQFRENYKIGAATMGGYLASSTGNSDVKAHFKRRAREVIWMKQAIQETEEEFPGFKIDPREVQMLTANDQPEETQDDEDDDQAPPRQPGKRTNPDDQ